MAESTRPMGPGGPGRHGPRGGFQKPKNIRATLGKLMAYLGRYKALLAVVVGVIVYFVLLFLLKGMETADLKGFPGGRFLKKIMRKLHLLRS